MCFYGIIYLKFEVENFLKKKCCLKFSKKVKFLAKRTAAATLL